jgi:hypothetical protein
MDHLSDEKSKLTKNWFHDTAIGETYPHCCVSRYWSVVDCKFADTLLLKRRVLRAMRNRLKYHRDNIAVVGFSFVLLLVVPSCGSRSSPTDLARAVIEAAIKEDLKTLKSLYPADSDYAAADSWENIYGALPPAPTLRGCKGVNYQLLDRVDDPSYGTVTAIFDSRCGLFRSPPAVGAKFNEVLVRVERVNNQWYLSKIEVWNFW